ncbi:MULTISPECIES: ImmA/IrrE family metallo-endopeptidase [unclassified Mesorhizobium]|uniref:ImmA/IrrE family metallo-endopeptidase n=1 Tax=unclassified Mesorhizobium TaxID=325217 RepID=UPI00120DBD9A|nr:MULTISPECIES: XRE family transcriptional regulator [unclassified Mesorhizobium]TIQ18163.1 MAG: ImmA/IrrE family metallo-endopeptidase [Mesorhizobium sp.]BCH17501.1 DNA-binding protein [Mesorhizobium sp. L-2-11]
MPSVNPDVLKWARETAGLDLEGAAKRLGLKDTRSVAGADRLAALENGDGEPSRPLLLKMAKNYRRPLLAFYLSAPPKRAERGEDFRTLPADYARRDEALVDALLREVRARQEMVRSLLEVEDEAKKLPFVGGFDINGGPKALAKEIEGTLSFNLAQFRRGARNDAFAYLRDLAEQVGVFVLLIGNLGSHHSTLDVELFRGVALADPVAPFVVINDQDSEAAWAFTLLHELAHIWIGRTGISGANPSSAIEVFCNDVAGQILMPEGESAREDALRGAPTEQVVARIRQLADAWRVSHSAVNYKLFREGYISREVWAEISGILRRFWLQSRAATRERNKDNENGPDYYVVRRHRLGNRLVTLSGRMLAEGALSPSMAGRILGVKPTNVYALTGASAAGASGRAA